MISDLTAGIVRILNPNGETSGTGFVLTGEGLIATCAHVVESAGAGPGDAVHLVFHQTGEEATATVEPEGWRAPEAEDVAILRLAGALSERVKPLLLGSTAHTANHPFETFGFPDANPEDGLWGKGEILGKTNLGGGRMLQLQSQEVTPGFSGAPIWETTTHHIVGMVTAITNPDAYGRLRDTAFATPIEVLDDIWPHLSLAQPIVLNTAPPLPDHFVARPTEFDQLISRLLDDITVDKKVALTTALQGGGGFGKTTLAQAICDHPHVQSAFSDGILWVELGQTPNLMGLLTDQIRLFRPEETGFTDLNLAAARLRELLAHRRVLLILDDVWQEAHARPFLPAGDAGWTTLITTRRQDVASRLNARPIDINEMTTQQAAELLASGLPTHPAHMQPLHDLAAHLGEWSLLLELAAAQLKELIEIDHFSVPDALTELWDALAEEGFTTFNREDEQQRNRSISRSLLVSLKRLGDQKERYLELAIFPEDIDIPFTAIERLWAQTAGLSRRQTKQAVRAMQRLSLFTRYVPQAQTVRLHDVIRHFLIAESGDKLRQVHGEFLRAYQSREAETASWTLETVEKRSQFIIPYAQLSLPFDERYLWTHLAYHLVEAGRHAELVEAVKDGRYLAVKTYLLKNASDAELDLLAAKTSAPDDTVLADLYRVFSQASHLLNHYGTLNALAATLHSRLQHEASLHHLVQPFRASLTPPYVKARHHLPDRPSPALRRTLRGHSNWVTGCAMSPDGRFIVSASRDKTLKVWEVETGAERLTLQGHTNWVNGCVISPDGTFIVSAAGDKTLKVWDVKTGAERLTLLGHTSYVTGCAISSDGSFIVSASMDKTLKVWEAKTGAERLTLQGHNAGVTGCAISMDGTIIFSASKDKTLKVWETATGAERLTLQGHRDVVTDCVISPDGRFIVSASVDKTLKVWETHSGAERLTLNGHTHGVTGCALGPDGTFIVSTSSDETVRLWEAESGAERLILQDHTDGVLNCTASQDGRFIVSASMDHTLKVWEVDREAEPLSPQGHRNWVNGCAISSDGSLTVSASEDTTLKVWDTHSGAERLTLSGHTNWVMDCAISQDARFIVSASRDKTLKVWDARTGAERLTLEGHTDDVTGCVMSPTGSFIVSASMDKTLKVWAVESGEEVRQLSAHTAGVTNCTISQDGRFIVSASMDKTLKVWDTDTGVERLTLQGHLDKVTGCAISPEGRFIVSTSEDHTLKVWAVRTGQCLTTFTVEGSLFACGWCPDGRHLVAVGGGGLYFLEIVW